jgi:hypothetical protein
LIYVDKNQLSQVEYLIHQSIQGNHVLFDRESLRQVFEETRLFEEEDAYSVEHHIEKLITQPTLEQKRAYLEGLDPETYGKVVRTYFNIVENNLFENSEVKH